MNKKKIGIAVRAAVQRGILIKPDHCQRCGVRKQKRNLAGHHHNGYGNPLDVVWLCQRCHTKSHFKEFGEHNGMSKLTNEVVAKLRMEYDGKWGKLTSLAKKYGIGISTVRDVVVKNTWR